MAEIVRPFVLAEPETKTALQQEFGCLPPDKLHEYRDVESVACQAFLARYGSFLSDKQRAYFDDSQILYTDPETAHDFAKEWEKDVHNGTEDHLIEDTFYQGYYLDGDDVGEPEVEPRHDIGQTIQQLWAGRIIVRSLSEAEASSVSPRWLLDRDGFMEATANMDTGFVACIEILGRSTEEAGIAIHEKVHGVQDPGLPLAVLEAAAYFYEMDIFETNKWLSRIEQGTAPAALAELYRQCVQDLGDDAHRLVFGNLPTNDPSLRANLLEKAKQYFTKAKLEAVKYPQIGPGLHWHTQHKDTVEFI